MLGIVGDRNTPGECAAADGEIAQSAVYKRHDFITPRLGTNEVRLVGVEFAEFVLEGGEFEEVIFFFDGFRNSAALRTGLAGTDFHVHLVRHTILAAIAAFVDVSVIANALE